jgi:SWI/SNF-related matrix-associated actin-dependent regulator 1 of chromatin subfamily A
MRICGKTNTNARHALVEKFQTDSNCKVALLSLLAGGVGLTLTASSVVIFCELYWNPGHLVQAEDRAHRIGIFPMPILFALFY